MPSGLYQGADVNILICAPLRHNAQLIEATLRLERLETRTVTPTEVLPNLDERSVLLLTQEGFTVGLRAALRDYLKDQPPWARLPILLLLDRHQVDAEVSHKIFDFMDYENIVVLHRPLRPSEFRTAVNNAVSARRRQLELGDQIKRQTELRHELNHRVKNIMATIQAIYRMTLRQSATIEDFASAFDGRLRALSTVHDSLADDSDGDRSLRAVADLIVEPFLTDERRITFSGDDMVINPNEAFTIALVLNELSTNALKYGALCNDAGTVEVTWTLEDRSLRVCWTERDGPAVTPPTRKGFGSRFIAASIASLGGTSDASYEPQGLRFSLVLPIAPGSQS